VKSTKSAAVFVEFVATFERSIWGVSKA